MSQKSESKRSKTSRKKRKDNEKAASALAVPPGENQARIDVESTNSLKIEACTISPPDGTTIINIADKSSSSTNSKESSARKKQRTCKCNCVKKHLVGSPHEESAVRRASQRLQIKNYKLPFEHLPRECKIHVFSYLTIFERGVAAQVCCDWRDLMQLPGVWSNIDLSVFNVSRQKPPGARHRSNGCYFCRKYETYNKQVSSFLQYLKFVRPSLKSLALTLDFGSKKDKWDKLLVSFLTDSRCSELFSVQLDWRQAPLQPMCYDSYCCHFSKVRCMFKLHIERGIIFEDFFNHFTKLTSRLRHLAIPFPWTWKNVRFLCRLKKLEHLSLDQYSVLKCPEQGMLDAVLTAMPNLRYLKLAICMPFFGHKKMFTVSHQRLEVLDIGQCQGFFLNQLNLPSLHAIHVSRAPWQGALLNPNKIPCIINLLLDGSTKVTHINKFQLDDYWKEYEYEEMKAHLDKVCPCYRHATRW